MKNTLNNDLFQDFLKFDLSTTPLDIFPICPWCDGTLEWDEDYNFWICNCSVSFIVRQTTRRPELDYYVGCTIEVDIICSGGGILMRRGYPGKALSGFVLHHTSYFPEEITPCCYDCHTYIHKNPERFSISVPEYEQLQRFYGL